MKKVKALVTLVVGKGEEVPPGDFCEVSDDEAKRLIKLEFASLSNEKTQNPPTNNADKNKQNQSKSQVSSTDSDIANHTEGTNKPQTKSKETDDDKPDQKSGGQPVSQTGDKG